MPIDDPPILKKLKPLLQSLLKTQQQLELLQKLRIELSEAMVDARVALVERRRTVLWPKDVSMTELDRTTRLGADTAAYERNYDLLVRIEQIVQDHIDIGKQLLK